MQKMERANNRDGLRKYQILPVSIVEDHHEVVPYIHKAIGSKHLPVSGNVLVHFDSHPDLLIPTSLKADDVYNKQILYDNSSIENWIIPLIYAGHISEVFWIKPPWCEQIQNKTIKFCVGKSKIDGYIRTSCKESYFVSEVLYMPDEDLIERQNITLTVITICPQKWSSLSNISSVNEKSDLVFNLERNNKNLENENKNHCTVDVSREPDQPANDSSCNDENAGISKKSQGCTDVCKISSTDSDEPSFKKLKFEESELQCESNENVLSDDFVKELDRIFQNLKDKHIILDIDLDFFSTKNPFKEMYSENQYKMLSELYQFDKPVSDSDEAIRHCVKKRQKQLDDIKEVLLCIKDGADLAAIFHKRSDLIHDLVIDLQKSHDPVDYELLHEAGCTCDDTELPHHVSSEEQITSLVDAVQEVLCHMQKPTIITMARSNNDDYCPPDQVDSIQVKVCEMLRDLYLEISVTEDYELNETENKVT